MRLSSLLLLAALPALAAETGREVLPAGRGPQRLELDAAALSASARADLGDLRLSDATGREVPYLLVQPSAPAGRWVEARLQRTPSSRKESGLEADLGAVRTVERLRVDGLGEPFLKRFRLEGSGDRVHWTVLVPDGTLFSLPREELRRLTVDFTRGDYRYLRLTWDDRSSALMGLPGAVLAFQPSRSPPTPAPLLVPLAVERRPAEPGRSRFALRLPGPRLPVRAVEVEVPGDRVHWPARVTESRLLDGQLGPSLLGQGLLRRVTRGDAEAEALRIGVAPPEELELELTVEDGDNPPLQLVQARAELAPVPWLYFESPDAGLLTLRGGDPERAGPRYDLEAARGSLATARPALARLGPAAPPAPAPPAPALESTGAPIDGKPFRNARKVAEAPPGLAALPLDAAVMGRTRGLADLRLAGPDGRQVPYLLEARDAPLVIELAALVPAPPSAAAAGTTTYVLTLPEPALPASRLLLSTDSRLFERLVRVLEDRPAAEGGPLLLGQAPWRHAHPERPAPPLTIQLPAVASARLLVRIDDGDNAPLPLAAPRLLLPGWRLRFIHPGPALTLLFGADGVEAPRYDLALLAPRLRAAPAREVALGPAAPAPGPSPWRPATVAWGALVAGVVAMLCLLVRLIRK